mmetsp:Transcript_13830/g.20688  ORF Transcript_13830/g.20688 Transcript_13830/m.20688 type:complete len:610 (-) Transcript_13830:170-1999(-)
MKSSSSNNNNNTTTGKHIRPKVRSRRNVDTTATTAATTTSTNDNDISKKEDDLDDMLAQTRQLLANMGHDFSSEIIMTSPTTPPMDATDKIKNTEPSKVKPAQENNEMKNNDDDGGGGILKTNPRYSVGGNNAMMQQQTKDKNASSSVLIVDNNEKKGNKPKSTSSSTPNMKTLASYTTTLDETCSLLSSSDMQGAEWQGTAKPFLKDVVMEKNPTDMNKNDSNAINIANAIEGYTPKHGSFQHASKKEKPLKKTQTTKKKSTNTSTSPQLPEGTFQSISELVSTAAALTSKQEYLSEEGKHVDDNDNATLQNIDNTTNEIETDLSFTYMSSEEYETVKLAESLGVTIDLGGGSSEEMKKNGNEYIKDEKEEEEPYHSDEEEEEYYDDDDDEDNDDDKENEDDDDDMFGFFTSSPGDEEKPEPEERPFLKLWTALSTWVTHESTILLREWKNELSAGIPKDKDVTTTTLRTPYDTSDVGSSRCAGFMSMLKMNVPKCLSEFISFYISTTTKNDKGYIQRIAETRLSNLVRTFDYTEPMVKLNGTLWKVLTFVMMEIVFLPHICRGGEQEVDANDSLMLPMAAKSIGMTVDEYRYLTQSALTKLSLGSSA